MDPSTFAILGGGPSLNAADVGLCRGRVRVLAIKDAVRLAPWADVLYACDAKWWKHWGDSLPTVPGQARYTLDFKAERWAILLRNTGETGLELQDPGGIRTGKNSGYQAMNLAVNLGARRLILLGFDMMPDAKGRHHWFGAHPWKTVPPYESFRPFFTSLAGHLAAAGIEVVNASRVTSLTMFRRADLRDVLTLSERG